jgi:hypothetical protein
MRLASNVACMGRGEMYKGFMLGKHEGKRPSGKSRRRCLDNIKMDLQEVGCGAWTASMWLRILMLVNEVINT